MSDFYWTVDRHAELVALAAKFNPPGTPAAVFMYVGPDVIDIAGLDKDELRAIDVDEMMASVIEELQDSEEIRDEIEGFIERAAADWLHREMKRRAATINGQPVTIEAE